MFFLISPQSSSTEIMLKTFSLHREKEVCGELIISPQHWWKKKATGWPSHGDYPDVGGEAIFLSHFKTGKKVGKIGRPCRWEAEMSSL